MGAVLDSEACGRRAGLAFRPAWDDEKRRVGPLFPEVARPGECFVAVRERPVERIVGAVFWRDAQGAGGALDAEFLWGALPALAGTPAEADFLLAFKDSLAALGRYHWLRSAVPLPEGGSTQILRDCGFEPAYRQDCYAGEWASWVTRTGRLLGRLKTMDRCGLETRPPAADDGEALCALAAARHLLAPGALQAALVGSDSHAVFDPEYSALLFQDGRLAGACLVKLASGHISIPVLVADEGVSAGLACALLFEHCQKSLADRGVGEVLFQTNPELSPEMPRLARRFDCRPAGTLTAWRMALATAGTDFSTRP